MHSQENQGRIEYSNSRKLNQVENSSSTGGQPEGKQEGFDALTAGLREWLRTQIKGMHAVLNSLSGNAWHYVRTRWGPEWVSELIGAKHHKRTNSLGDDEEYSAENVAVNSAWWFWSREGPPTARARNGAYLSKRTSNRPSRLRNPRSKRTRELCLLNRLRVNLNDRVLLAVGNEETSWGTTIDGVPRLAGSYEIQSQRWAKTLPRSSSQYSAQRHANRTTGVPPRRREPRHW